MKREKLMALFRQMKNELSDDAKPLAIALQEAIQEAENSEGEITADELKERVRRILDETLPEVVDETPEVQASIRRLLVKGADSAKNTYLASVHANRDFLATIRNSRNSREFKNAWTETLVKNGINGLSFPTAVDKEIQTAWGNDNGLFNALRHVSNTNFTIQYADADTNEQLAYGHVKGNEKKAQVISVSPKSVLMKGIYKDQYVDRVDLAQMDDDTAFLRWLVSELAERLAFTIEAKIISGDIWTILKGSNTATAADNKISSFESIGDKTTTDAWTEVYTRSASEEAITTLRKASLAIQNRGRDIWLYISPSLFQTLTERKYSTGGSPFVVGADQLASEIGVARVVIWKYFATGTEAVFITPDLYYRVGGEPFGEQSSIFLTNQEAYRAEVFAGGAIAGLKSTAVIRSSASN